MTVVPEGPRAGVLALAGREESRATIGPREAGDRVRTETAIWRNVRADGLLRDVPRRVGPVRAGPRALAGLNQAALPLPGSVMTTRTVVRGRFVARVNRSGTAIRSGGISRVAGRSAGSTRAAATGADKALVVGRAAGPRKVVRARIVRGRVVRKQAIAMTAVDGGPAGPNAGSDSAKAKESGVLARTAGPAGQPSGPPYGRSRTIGSGPTGRPIRSYPST